MLYIPICCFLENIMRLMESDGVRQEGTKKSKIKDESPPLSIL